jgi:hypothetical protein
MLAKAAWQTRQLDRIQCPKLNWPNLRSRKDLRKRGAREQLKIPKTKLALLFETVYSVLVSENKNIKNKKHYGT